MAHLLLNSMEYHPHHPNVCPSWVEKLGCGAKKAKGMGANQIIFMGVMLFGLMFSAIAIDFPLYYIAQNQLQTAVNAAAVAGATELPIGESEAEEAANELAMEHDVLGNPIVQNDITYRFIDGDQYTFGVYGEKQIPTVMGKFICGLKGVVTSGGGGTEGGAEPPAEEGGQSADGNDICSMMTVKAKAQAVPVARDVILVIDTSGSMNNLGNGQPFLDVKEAAHAYIDKVKELNSDAVDRIGVVTFDYSAAKEIGLSFAHETDDFDEVKDTIDDLTLYNGGQWWNTNYHAGLVKALDEIQNNGRKNSAKTIIFLTDGYPNQPDGPDWYYKDCINAESNADTYKSYANWYYNNGYWSYGNYYNNLANQNYQYSYNCTLGYTDHMINVTQDEALRARNMDVTIHTIQIGPPPNQSNSLMAIRDMLNDGSWDAELLEYIATETYGDQYEAATNDGDKIQEIYETIAQDVRIRLTN